MRHLSGSESHGSHGGWSPNCKSSGRSPKPRSSSQKEGLEGAEEATLMGLDDMASGTERVTGARSLLGKQGAWGKRRDTRGGGGTNST